MFSSIYILRYESEKENTAWQVEQLKALQRIEIATSGLNKSMDISITSIEKVVTETSQIGKDLKIGIKNQTMLSRRRNSGDSKD